jgi:ribosome-associated toxin RatA of RatAB toxin-antitoxin module
MRIVELQVNVPGRTPSDVYATLADFGRYPELSEAVRSVEVTSVTEDSTISRWEVTFRSGILCWTEEDTFDRDALTIDFRQIEGDVALFDGSWQCAAAGENADLTVITFTARLDMGIPSLADALEPIAARALVDNTVSIVEGLFGTVELANSRISTPEKAGSAR